MLWWARDRRMLRNGPPAVPRILWRVAALYALGDRCGARATTLSSRARALKIPGYAPQDDHAAGLQIRRGRGRTAKKSWRIGRGSRPPDIGRNPHRRHRRELRRRGPRLAHAAVHDGRRRGHQEFVPVEAVARVTVAASDPHHAPGF